MDIKELRRLAQAALIGPDGVSMRWLKLLKDFQEEANPSEVLEILDRLEAAESENAKLRIALAEKVTSETTLRDLNVGNGFINATFEGGAVQPMLDALADQFVESGASNYIEMQFHSKAALSLLFTLQRVDGKTPHQLRAEAEQERDWHAERCEDAMNECDALRAKIDQMEQMEPVAWYSKQYGFVYMSRQPSQFEHGSILYLRNGAPAWRIEGSSKVALLDIASLPHGTVFYAFPGAKEESK